MSAIREIKAKQILDSRGNLTVEVDVRLESRRQWRLAVPRWLPTLKKEEGLR